MKTRLTFAAFTFVTLLVFTPPLHAFQNDEVWTGGGTTNNWSDPGNWTGPTAPPTSDDFLHFAGSIRTMPNNDFSPNFAVDQILFDSGAASFTLNGNAVGFFDVNNPRLNLIQNNSTKLQTLNFTNNGGSGGNAGILFGGVPGTIDAASGNILLSVLDIELESFSPHQADLTFTGSFNTTLTANNQGIFDTFNAAGVIKNGSGTLFFPNDNSYSGGTTINAGILQIGSLNSLGVPAHFGFMPPPNQTVLNGGTLQTIPETPLTFNVPGDFVQNGGTLRIQLGSSTTGVNNDLMQVNNGVTLGANSFLFIHRIDTYTPAIGDTVTIITTNNGVTGTFSDSSPVASDFPGLIQPFALYPGTTVDIQFRLGSFTSVPGLTFNQNAVAVALNQAFADMCLPASTFSILGFVPIADLPHVYDLIAPEEFAAMYEMSFSRAVVQSGNLQGRMDQIRANADPDCGPIVEINPAPEGKNVVGKNVVAPAPAPAPDNRLGTFAMGSGQYVTVHNQDDNADGYKITNGSFLAGVDYRLLHNLAIGVYGGYVGSEANLVGRGRITADGGTAGGYATFFTHGFYLQAAGGGNWNSYENRRDAFLGQAHGSTNGSEVNAMGALGYDWTMNFNAANHPGSLTVGPIASVQYTNVDINGYSETGSLIPLEFPDQSEDSLRSTIGGKLAICLQTDHGIMLRPEVRVAWLHEYNDRAYPIKAFFLGCDDLFTVRGPTIGADAAQVTAGLTVQFNPMVALFAHYDGLFGRDNYDSNGVSGGLALSF
ncbi:MAG TPA: autotransporter domain-containing protein [Chthoniobacterales bacterium]|nr:autotransporter domain-containing protein [Chthoniobacterales bacterium]